MGKRTAQKTPSKTPPATARWTAVSYLTRRYFLFIFYLYYPRAAKSLGTWNKCFVITGYFITLITYYEFPINHFLLWSYTIFFVILNKYVATEHGDKPPLESSFDHFKKLLLLLSSLTSFRIYTFYHTFMRVYSQGANNSHGISFKHHRRVT